MKWTKILFSVLIAVAAVVGQDEEVIVETQYGKIRGYTTEATNGRPIYGFKSIPFAKPPVRFQAPVPLSVEEDGWGDEIRDGTRNPPSCPQTFTNLSPISEDCLYLNVYSPIKPGSSQEKLPVMFWIYGGGFVFGDSVFYGPNRLLANDVILVVIHYRLGAFGFLSTEDEVVPGNAGFKDMREALRWVNANIESFNGDASKITVFGESAGAASATALLASPSARGLFSKVIAQSGSVISPWAFDRHPLESAKAVAEFVACPTEPSSELVQCLRTKPIEDILNATSTNLQAQFVNININFEAAALVIEPELEGAFMTQDPAEILRRGDFPHDVPILLGSVQHESSFILAGAWAANLVQNGQLDDPNFVQFDLLPKLLGSVGFNDGGIGAPLSQVLSSYFYPENAQFGDFSAIIEPLVDALSVLLFKGSILRTADYVNIYNPGNVYLYSFEHKGVNTVYNAVLELLQQRFDPPEPVPIPGGIMHADDLMYFWTLPFFLQNDDRTFSDTVCKMWTDFAITGNPTPTESPNVPKWLPYSTAQPYYYKLALQSELRLDYRNNWRQGY